MIRSLLLMLSLSSFVLPAHAEETKLFQDFQAGQSRQELEAKYAPGPDDTLLFKGEIAGFEGEGSLLFENDRLFAVRLDIPSDPQIAMELMKELLLDKLRIFRARYATVDVDVVAFQAQGGDSEPVSRLMQTGIYYGNLVMMLAASPPASIITGLTAQTLLERLPPETRVALIEVKPKETNILFTNQAGLLSLR